MEFPLKAILPIRMLAASVGWNASQNTYWFLLGHGVWNGRHVIWPLFLPMPQHPLFTTLNPSQKESKQYQCHHERHVENVHCNAVSSMFLFLCTVRSSIEKDVLEHAGSVNEYESGTR